MKTIYKLILKSYVGPMFLTFFIVMFIFIMNFLWKYVDELVGKGLDMSVILELMMYAAIVAMPMALPLATLLASIMTMGSMGENYELLAMKSAGMSLPRIMKPLLVLMVFVSIGGFFAGNNLVPWASRQSGALLFDIRKQKQEIEFKDGTFMNTIPNMSIRVERQDPETNLLRNVLIYDYKNLSQMSTTIADSGYITLSDDKKLLLVTLYNGESFQENRGAQWYNNSSLTRNTFERQDMVVKMDGFDFERTDASLFSSASMYSMGHLKSSVDSLYKEATILQQQAYGPLFQGYIFQHDQSLAVDSLRTAQSTKYPVLVTDSIAILTLDKKREIWNTAATAARNSRHVLQSDETQAKKTLTDLYRYKIEWHNKMALPVSIMIFFLIGAPLGAIIRRGGLGMPVVVSVAFFVIYYMISILGKQMAQEGSIETFIGSWISTFVLLPVGLFLIYKATNDSNLFNADWYFIKFGQLRDYAKKEYNKIKTKYGHSKKGA